MTTLDEVLAKGSSELPDEPSKLLLVALRDLEKAEVDDGVRIDMGEWYRKRLASRCLVCMAGAVMRYSLRANEVEGAVCITPMTFVSDELTDKLDAINEFRTGSIQAALGDTGMAWDEAGELSAQIYVAAPDKWKDLTNDDEDGNLCPPHYAERPAEFKEYIRWLSTELKERGH